MNNRVLVTGGCGFVGSNLVSKLLSSGYKVTVLDDLSRGRRSYLEGLDYKFVQADIRDQNACREAFVDVDQVVHLAAFGNVVESVAEPHENFLINALGTLNILTLAVENSVKKFVFSSTGGALIGDALPPVNESSLPKPISPYGAGKLTCEAYCNAFHNSYGLNTVCLRFANVYGPNSDHKTGVINKFFSALQAGHSFTIFGNGSSTRDYIHVSDLCNGIYLALENKNLKNEVIHLATGREVSLAELAQIVIKSADLSTHPIEHMESRKGEVDRNFADYSYAKSILGFEPKIVLEDGLKALWESTKHES